MPNGKFVTIAAVGALAALLAWPAVAREKGDATWTIDVPQPTFEAQKPYGGRTRVLIRSVRDRRLVDPETYFGEAHLGLNRHPVALHGAVSAKASLEGALRGALEASHLLASSPEEATVFLDVDLLGLIYANELFFSGAYGTAEILYQASLTAASGPEGAEPAVRSLVVRAFHVQKATTPSNYTADILRDALQQAGDRLLASESLGSFIEEENRAAFRREIPLTPDLEKWVKKSARVFQPDPDAETATPVDLSAYRQLYVGGMQITDKEYGDSAQVFERQLRQTIYAKLVGALHSKFRSISAGEAPPAGKTLLLTCEFPEFVPFRQGTKAASTVMFGVLGLGAGQGQISGVMQLKDGETGATIAELPLESSVSFASNELMIEDLARRIAAFVARGKADDPDPLVEVSWAKG